MSLIQPKKEKEARIAKEFKMYSTRGRTYSGKRHIEKLRIHINTHTQNGYDIQDTLEANQDLQSLLEKTDALEKEKRGRQEGSF